MRRVERRKKGKILLSQGSKGGNEHCWRSDDRKARTYTLAFSAL